jgi:two-component system sensor histidine kinase MprB
VSFRRRIALLTGAAVAVAILLASTLAYVTTRSELRGRVDDSLQARAQQFVAFVSGRVGGPPFPGRGDNFRRPPQRRGGFDFYEQFVTPNGTVQSPDGTPLQAGPRTREVAAGRSKAFFTDITTSGDHVRTLVTPLPGGGALVIGRSVGEVDTILHRIRWILFVVSIGGVALAAALGRFVAGRAIEPLRRLTATAEHVAATQDLGERIDVGGEDEIGRLATRFNEMLDALEGAMRSQRQLVADASHELRTPVTSLRTNIEVLQRNPNLDPARRAAVLARASAQAEELTALMNDLIALARGDAREEGHDRVRLDELVDEAIERAARHAPDQRFDVDLAEATVVGSADRLTKAVNNLLDNAVKWNASGRPIDVRLRPDGELTVRDRGPGFAPDELGHVFDRFFRGAESRERSGSGLGLAIVRQVAETHGGAVEAHNAPDGGAVLTLRLPARPLPVPAETPRVPVP